MRNRSNLDWDIQTVLWPRTNTEQVFGRDSNLWMFADDLAMELWAHFHRISERGGAEQQSAYFEDCSKDVTEKLMDVLPGQHGRHMELADILREFATMNAGACPRRWSFL